jgi:Flp pilus assembly protein TadD
MGSGQLTGQPGRIVGGLEGGRYCVLDRKARANVAKGGEKYQQAFYVFEELAQAPATSSIQSLISQAVAEIHLGRLDEAEAALKQAIAKDPKNAEAISNSIVLNVIQGKDTTQLKRYVPFLAIRI